MFGHYSHANDASFLAARHSARQSRAEWRAAGKEGAIVLPVVAKHRSTDAGSGRGVYGMRTYLCSITFTHFFNVNRPCEAAGYTTL